MHSKLFKKDIMLHYQLHCNYKWLEFNHDEQKIAFYTGTFENVVS